MSGTVDELFIPARASVSRIFDSIQGLAEGIAAAKALHLLDITVTTTHVGSHATDAAYVPGAWRYHLDAREATP